MGRLFFHLHAIGLLYFFSMAFVLMVVLPTAVGATNNQQDTWLNTPISVVNFYALPSLLEDEYSCSGDVTAITIGTQGIYTPACVFGSNDSVKMARYLDAHYTYRYAYALPHDTLFYPLRSMCDGKKWCVYAPSSDVLLLQRTLSPWVDGHVVIPQASRLISFHSDDGGYFQLDSPTGTEYVEKVVGTNTAMYASGSVAVSENGLWAVIEVRNMGFVRINLSTLAMKRIATTGLVYGFGYDPRYELAISNSGNQIVVAGNNAGIQVYEVSETCGDVIAEGSNAYFSPSTQPCQSASLNRDTLFPGFVVANRPKFSDDGKTISFFVITHTQRGVAIIRPGVVEPGLPSLYLAFGDSFSSGEGEIADSFYIPATNTQSNHCHVSTRSYPYLLGARWHMETASYACSGATTATMRDVIAAQANNNSQVSPPLLSIGIGGNDVEVMGKLRTCLNIGTCEWALPDKRKASAEEIRALLPLLVEFIHDVSEVYGGSQVFIVGYPLVINADENAICSTLIASLLDRDERIYMDQSVRLLNDVIRTAAAISHVTYIDVQDSLVGERLCDFTEAAMNGIRMGDDIAPFPIAQNLRFIGAESFHPTYRGHQLMADDIDSQFAGGHVASSCSSCVQEITLQDYWNEPSDSNNYPLVRQMMKKFLYINDIVVGTYVSFSFPIGTFEPLSEVSFEVHSNIVNLDSFTSSSDGSLKGSVFIPVETEEGFHALHALGTDVYNNPVDIYQIITTKASNTFISPQPIHTNHISDVKPDNDNAPLEYGEYSEGDEASVLGVATSNDRTTIDRDEPSALPMLYKGLAESGPVSHNISSLDGVKLVMNGMLWVLAGIISIIISMNIRKIVKAVIPTKVFRAVEPAGHLIEAMLVSVLYGHPAKKMRVIGVTGTNGKTTTSFMIHRMLNEAGIKTAISSTVGYGVGSDIHYQQEHMTTSKASVLQKRLRQFAKEGAEWVVIEASSHGLAQNRLWGVPFEIAVLTNITHDHLEYHKTFERYREAKRKLFRIANKHGLRYGIVNADDPSADIFAQTVANHTTYGITHGDIKAKNIKLTSSNTSYIATTSGETYTISLQLPGGFNVSNSLAALAVGRTIGLTKAQIEHGLGALESVKGRMNAVNEGQPYQVLIDFASTPDGFEKFFETVRPLVKGKLVAVFGSAGRRDETKRSEQGYIAGKFADVVIATEEDNRDDDAEKILQQISEGAKKAGKIKGKSLFTIANREDAIGFAFTTVSSSDDMVVLLGKGHEKTIERADGEYPWDEFDVARTAIRALVSEKNTSS